MFNNDAVDCVRSSSDYSQAEVRRCFLGILSDAWRRAYFTTGELSNEAISGDDADPDQDGFSNWKEFVAGTIPTNGASYLRITAFAANPGAGGGYVVSWQSATGRMYTLLGATDWAVGFTNVVTNIPATPMLNVHTDNVSGAGSRFYRVKVEAGN